MPGRRGHQVNTGQRRLSHHQVERTGRVGSARQEQDRSVRILEPRGQKLPGIPHGHLRNDGSSFLTVGRNQPAVESGYS